MGDVDGVLPSDILEGRPPMHECACGALNAVETPFLARDRRDGVRLFYVTMERASAEENDAALQHLLKYLRTAAATNWTPAWLKTLQVVARGDFAAWLRSNRDV